MLDDEPTGSTWFSAVKNTSDSISKIKSFMPLFKGRDDVYAKKWENKNKATSGYSPVCLNQWQVGLCGKPKTFCSKCANRLYAALDEHVIENPIDLEMLYGIYAGEYGQIVNATPLPHTAKERKPRLLSLSGQSIGTILNAEAGRKIA